MRYALRHPPRYGGQMPSIVPALHLTVVMTSDEASPSARTGYRDQLNALMQSIITAVVEAGGGGRRAG